MFATIVFGIALVLLILIAIIYLKSIGGSESIFTPVLFMIVAIIGLTITLKNGYTSPDIERKHEIEMLLTIEVSAETIDKAQKYNNTVNENNNLWNRFTIEDRSEYLIDIDYYISKITED